MQPASTHLRFYADGCLHKFKPLLSHLVQGKDGNSRQRQGYGSRLRIDLRADRICRVRLSQGDKQFSVEPLSGLSINLEGTGVSRRRILMVGASDHNNKATSASHRGDFDLKVREEALAIIEDFRAQGDAQKIDRLASSLMLGLEDYANDREFGLAVVAQLRRLGQQLTGRAGLRAT